MIQVKVKNVMKTKKEKQKDRKTDSDRTSNEQWCLGCQDKAKTHQTLEIEKVWTANKGYIMFETKVKKYTHIVK